MLRFLVALALVLTLNSAHAQTPGVAVGDFVDISSSPFEEEVGSDVDVTALVAAPEGGVYVGGYFSAIGNGSPSVARWDGAAWRPLGAGIPRGLGDNVSALAVAPDGSLYAGGTFSEVGGVPAQNVARWDGTAWSPLGAGIDGQVLSLTVAPDGTLYAGGSFSTAGGVQASNIARWNGSTWSAVGGGTSSTVYDLRIGLDGTLYASGIFSTAGGVTVNRMARWDGTAWSALGTGFSSGFVVQIAVVPDGSVYACGNFTTAGGVPAQSIARWDDTAWRPLASAVDGIVTALARAPDGSVYAGGGFTTAGHVLANRVARWNGALWSPLGEGLDGSAAHALAVAPDGTLYAGGAFSAAGNVPASHVARWDGTAWSALGAGTNAAVYALARAPDGTLYAGGAFTTAGGAPASRVARWDGTAWSALGAGTNGVVNALAVAPDGTLYAGGAFSAAGGTPASHVARWDGTAWSALGSGADDDVRALTVGPDGTLYAGGDFVSAGGVPARGIARWDGAAWSALGTGTFDATVVSIAVAPDGSLYAGGAFFSIGGTTARNLARWDGTAWSALGAGADAPVYSLAFDASGDLLLGGLFATAGGVASPFAALYDAPAPPAPTGAFAFMQPSAGDSYNVGAWLKAIWSSPEPSPARVVLSLRRGSADPIEVYRGPNLQIPDFGAARYLIPEGTLAADDYRFRIEDEAAPATFVVSDFFSITDPDASFTFTSPVGGEAIALGSTRLVTWTSPAALPGGSVALSLVDKATGATIASLTTANDGEAPLAFPASPAGRYTLTITSEQAPSYTGATRSFQLSSVAATRPLAGGTYDEGDALVVRWQSPTLTDPSATVQLLLKRPGLPALELAAATPNDGLFQLPVPSGLAPASDYYVLVRVTSGGVRYAAKSGLFAIAGTGAPALVPPPAHLALAPLTFGTREATLAVTGLADGTEVGVYAGRSLVGAGVAVGGVARVDVRGVLVLDGLVTGAVTEQDIVEIADGTPLTLVTVREGVEQVLATIAPVAFADGAEIAITVPGAASMEAPSSSLAVAAFPNPTAASATVRVSLPSAEALTVAVFDVLGRRVATLFDGPAPAGTTTRTWDARGAAPGVYVVRVTSATARASQRLTVVR